MRLLYDGIERISKIFDDENKQRGYIDFGMLYGFDKQGFSKEICEIDDCSISEIISKYIMWFDALPEPCVETPDMFVNVTIEEFAKHLKEAIKFLKYTDPHNPVIRSSQEILKRYEITPL